MPVGKESQLRFYAQFFHTLQALYPKLTRENSGHDRCSSCLKYK